MRRAFVKSNDPRLPALIERLRRGGGEDTLRVESRALGFKPYRVRCALIELLGVKEFDALMMYRYSTFYRPPEEEEAVRATPPAVMRPKVVRRRPQQSLGAQVELLG
jgi:L-lysine 2,3-aminomutase